MLQVIVDIIFAIWLSILTFILFRRILFRRQDDRIKTKIIKNKKDTRAKRYIIFYLVTASNENVNINSNELENAIRNSIKELMGKMWLEIANPKIVLYLPDRKQGIISTNRVGYKAVLASLPLVKNIGDMSILVVPKKTTGSLKKAKRILGIR